MGAAQTGLRAGGELAVSASFTVLAAKRRENVLRNNNDYITDKFRLILTIIRHGGAEFGGGSSAARPDRIGASR